ncbi:MAG: hypothetical protein KGS10_05600 [Chloroflexi bacterium]|nr:hypothetical protein [Chloroflexota bacterium]
MNPHQRHAFHADQLDLIRAALGNGADEDLWPPGLTLVEAVASLVARYRALRRTIDDDQLVRFWIGTRKEGR